MPMSTLLRLLDDVSLMKYNQTVVMAFDGTRREAIGEIELRIQVDPFMFNVNFQVMDILSSYNCLLGRLWFHMVGVVLSTLHQQLKFVVDDLLNYVAA